MIEQIVALLPENSEYYFYRTNAGAEIDFIFMDKNRQPVAVEIKYTLSPSVSKGFWNAYEDLSCTRGYIIYPGSETYPIGKNVTAMPLDKLKTIVMA